MMRGKPALLAIALWAVPGSAGAQSFLTSLICGGPSPGPCASWLEQTIQTAQQAEIVRQQILNTLSLGTSFFQDGAGQIQQTVQLASRADLLLGNSGQFIANLSANRYPLPADPMQQIVNQQNAIGNAVQQLGRVIGVVNPQLASRATILAAIQRDSLGVAGRKQALQEAAQLAAMSGQDLHSLVTVTTSMAQGQHAALLAEHDRRAMEDAKMDQFSTFTPLPTTGWRGF